MFKKRKAVVGGSIQYVNFLKNWVHQAFTYMDTGEQCFRVIVEFIEFCLFAILFVNILNLPLIVIIIITIFIVHTFNWVTNCVFWALILFAIPDLKNPGEEKTVIFLNKMTARLKKHGSISGLAIYGSLSRGKWHNRSDIDIRIIRCTGFLNLISSCFLTMQERLIAFIAKQPMDLYLADGVDFLEKMRCDEKPIFLIKRDIRLEKMYPNNPEQILTELK